MANLTIPQAAFLQLPQKFRGYVGGFGSGKTWVGCTAICEGMWTHPRINQGYFAPTYPQIRDIFYPTIDEVAFEMGLRIKVNQGNKEVHFYNGQTYRGTTICRSMEKPETIVGFKIGNALVDELDVMKPEKAKIAWRKIIARMRYKVDGLRNGIDVTTTPEGYRFVYEQFFKLPSEKPGLAQMYGLIQASTYDNERFLPDDYIPSLLQSYPPQLVEAYLMGRFVNLTSGSVYADFDRKANHTDATLQSGEPLHVGMDFNVKNMTAILGVERESSPIIVGELTQVRDTPAMAQLLVERFKKNGHHVTVYPDASGQNTSSNNASESDLIILQNAGLTIRAPSANPPVRDRVNAVNAQIHAGGKRRMLVNTRLAPTLTECLEQQVYDKNGDPDKEAGKDHAPDAVGYWIHYRWPIKRPATPIRTVQHMNR